MNIFRANPSSEAAENYDDRLAKANEEIYRLKERIRVMEEGNNEDVTRIVEERCQGASLKEINGTPSEMVISNLH